MVIIDYRHILVAFLAPFLLWAQDPFVELSVEPEFIEVGQHFTISVHTNVQGDINIQLPKYFVHGHNVVNGMEQQYDANSGKMVTVVYYAKSGMIVKPGKYEIGPATVKKGNKVYRSNLVKIKVNDFDEEDVVDEYQSCDKNTLKKSAFGQVEISKNEVYVGEAVAVNAKVVSKFRPNKYDSYEGFETRPAIEKYEIDKKGSVQLRVEKVGCEERYVFDLDQNVIFPGNPGKVHIKPFHLILQSGYDAYPVKAEKRVLKVKPLPPNAPPCFQGGVGAFEMTGKPVSIPKRQGEVLTYEVELKGKGNMHNLSAPKLVLPEGFELYGDPEVKESHRFTSVGAVGKIKATYHIQVNKAGTVEFPPVQYAFFNPKKDNYQVLQVRGVSFDLEPNASLVEEDQSVDMSLEKYVLAEDPESKAWYQEPWVLLVGGGLPILALLAVMFIKRTPPATDELEVPQSAEVEQPEFNQEKALRDLLQHQGSNDFQAYFASLNKELHAAFAYKCGTPELAVVSSIEMDKVLGKMTSEQADEIKALFETCQTVRYGQQQPSEDLSVFTKKARAAFNAIQQA